MFKEEYLDYMRSFNQKNIPHHSSKILKKSRFFDFGRLLLIAGDESWIKKHGEKNRLVGNNQIEYGSAVFCRLLFLNNKFHVFIKNGNEYFVRVFDQNWQFTGLEKKLTPEGVRETDEDVASDGRYIYHFAMIGRGAGQIRKFDKGFNIITKTPIFEAGFEDIVGDQNIALIKGKIYAGSHFSEKRMLRRKGRDQSTHNMPPSNEIKTGTHLRIFDTNLNLIDERNLIARIDQAMFPHQYWGRGASQLYADGYYCIVAASPIGNMSYFNRGESIGARQIFILRFDDEFNFVDSKGPLTDTDNDNFWCTGSWYDKEEGRYYVNYMCRRPGEGCVPRPKGPQPKPKATGLVHNTTKLRRELRTVRESGFSGMGNVLLSIYDENFNELETLRVTNFKVKSNVVTNTAARPNLFKEGNNIYVTYDTGKQAFVQELFLKR